MSSGNTHVAAPAWHHQDGVLMLGGESQGRLSGHLTAKFNLGAHSKDKLKAQSRMCDRREPQVE